MTRTYPTAWWRIIRLRLQRKPCNPILAQTFFCPYFPMSGHSKWNTIKRKKAVTDAKKNKVLSQHSKILMSVARTDPNPETNTSLRAAIRNAKADSVPSDNIERILKKMRGDGANAAIYQQQVYEGFAPGGVPFIIVSLTDNPNRAFASIRTAVQKNGGQMGTPGSVAFQFEHVGLIAITTGSMTEDTLTEKVLESGAKDLEYDPELSIVITEFTDFGSVRDALSQTCDIAWTKIVYRPCTAQEVTDEKHRDQLERFIAAVEEADDMDEIFLGCNLEDENNT